MNIHTRPATAHCGLITSRTCREESDIPQVSAVQRAARALDLRGALRAQRPRNMARLLQSLRRLRLMPLPGGGTGLQQPVHVDDLAAAIVNALARRRAQGLRRRRSRANDAPRGHPGSGSDNRPDLLLGLSCRRLGWTGTSSTGIGIANDLSAGLTRRCASRWNRVGANRRPRTRLEDDEL